MDLAGNYVLGCPIAMGIIDKAEVIGEMSYNHTGAIGLGFWEDNLAPWLQVRDRTESYTKYQFGVINIQSSASHSHSCSVLAFFFIPRPDPCISRKLRNSVIPKLTHLCFHTVFTVHFSQCTVRGIRSKIQLYPSSNSWRVVTFFTPSRPARCPY